jgi:hypothetical protein
MTIKELQSFIISYKTTEKFKHLRLGQAFIIEFFPFVNDPDTFYCEDDNEAIQKIYNKYIQGAI